MGCWVGGFVGLGWFDFVLCGWVMFAPYLLLDSVVWDVCRWLPCCVVSSCFVGWLFAYLAIG